VLRALHGLWDRLTPEEREIFIRQPGNELVSAILDSYEWMTRWTKTRDDQDHVSPYKPLNRPYLKLLHEQWLINSVLYLEKSRSMMGTWWATAEAIHSVMTHPPAKAIFWAQDEDRAVVMRDYAWVLWEQMHPDLQRLFPVVRPKAQQHKNKIEFLNGSICVALPGKDPNKIRSEHPSVLVIDEACFVEKGAEAFDIAKSSRVPKILLVSSAAPGWLRRLTKDAVPEPLSSPHNHEFHICR
jgi:hypothetical protein